MSDNSEVPGWLEKLPPRTEADVWEDLEWDFSDGCEMIRNLRFETKEDAAKFRWTRDRGFVAPYNSTLDADDLKELQTELAGASSFIRQALDSRTLSLELVAKWGLFQWASGRLTTAYYADGSDENRRQAGLSKEKQDRWVGIQLRALNEEGNTRQQAEYVVLQRIANVLEQRSWGEFGEKWFRDLLAWDEHNKPENLAQRFQGDNGKLPTKRLYRYIGAPRNDIPPIPGDEPSGLA